ncbi:hypothetical protein [Streptomyces sp. Y1]|uniref:Uncharacterized protein n=1 Tax=Streptomyces sp. Y1 TaxID=3238634 RepID=A0AB39TXN6_9ACTN
MSRSTAHRLLDLAATAEAIEDVVDRQHQADAGGGRDPRAPGRAREPGRRAPGAGPRRGRRRAAGPDGIRAAVTAAIAELREQPDVPVVELESRPGPGGCPVEAWRAMVAWGHGLARQRLDAHRDLGLLALRVAPGYVADRGAEEVLHVLGEEIGSSAEEPLACRYAMTGDKRATERF